MPFRVRAIFPVLVSVTVCAALDVPTPWLPNARLAGDRIAVAVPTPEPINTTTSGLVAALLAMTRLPFRAPGAAGVKVKLIVQLLLPEEYESIVGQSLLWLKSPAFAPLIDKLIPDRSAVPSFVKVTVTTELVVPIG